MEAAIGQPRLAEQVVCPPNKKLLGLTLDVNESLSDFFEQWAHVKQYKKAPVMRDASTQTFLSGEPQAMVIWSNNMYPRVKVVQPPPISVPSSLPSSSMPSSSVPADDSSEASSEDSNKSVGMPTPVKISHAVSAASDMLPKENPVLQYTKAYVPQVSKKMIETFMNEHCTIGEGYTGLNALYTVFKKWFAQTYPDAFMPTKNTMSKAIGRHIEGVVKVLGKNRGWNNLQVKK